MTNGDSVWPGVDCTVLAIASARESSLGHLIWSHSASFASAIFASDLDARRLSHVPWHHMPYRGESPHQVKASVHLKAPADEVRDAVGQGRKVLVLTERTEHLDAIMRALDGLQPTPFVLHGRMTKKRRAALIADLDALPSDSPRVLLSTGKLVGEGFDHPPLGTLVLAMPVSWKGTLQQYAGRLHREHPGKSRVRIIDFVDTGHPTLLRMWEKRLRGYRTMGYRVVSDELDG